MRTYPMSRQGRRQAIILLLGVASIWIFALWSLVTIFEDGITGVEVVSLTLMLGMLLVAPVVAWTLLEEAYSSVTTGEDGIRYRTFGGINLTYGWEELAGFKPGGGRGRLARFFLGDEDTDVTNTNLSTVEAGAPRMGQNPTEIQGQTEAAPGGAVDAAGAGAHSGGSTSATGEDGDDEEDAETDTLLLRVRNDRTAQIANPLVRFLHRQAHGSSLPIYGGLEDRDLLLGEIAGRLHAS